MDRIPIIVGSAVWINRKVIPKVSSKLEKYFYQRIWKVRREKNLRTTKRKRTYMLKK